MGDKYTDAQKKATMKYLKEKTDSIQIRTPKGALESVCKSPGKILKSVYF